MGDALSQVQEFGMSKNRCQNFLHRLLESIEVRPELIEQPHETVDLHGTGRATPGTLYEPGKDFATIFFFVGLVVAIEENSLWVAGGH